MAHLTYAKQSAASVPTPPANYVSQFIDTADGIPKYKDETGTVTSMEGAPGSDGPPGNSLTRPAGTLTSSGGVVTVDLSSGIEVYTLTLTENVTGWNFTNLPASGYVAELRIDIIQHASSAKTVASPATAGRTAGGAAWSVSSVLNSRESLGLAITSAGNVTLYPSGVFG